jgi:DNA-binding response OmpR family regulator
MQLAQRILVIDDSHCMLQVLGQILKSHCSALLLAGTHADARQHLERDPEIDLVICDVMLPDGNGFDLLAEIAGKLDSPPTFLLITARWIESDGPRARELCAIGYLPKPVSLQDIRSALAAAPFASTGSSRSSDSPSSSVAPIGFPRARRRLDAEHTLTAAGDVATVLAAQMDALAGCDDVVECEQLTVRSPREAKALAGL